MDDRKYWLGFSRVSGIGPKRVAALLKQFDTLAQAWQASDRQLRQAQLDDRARSNLLNLRDTLDLDAEMARVSRLNAQLLCITDDHYPPLLKELPDPPLVLYVQGEILPDDHSALSIVGTRKASHYGREAAYKLASALAGQNITIVSGLAHGIDTAAHRAALDAGGRTIAVLGCGIDLVYPQDNKQLAQAIRNQGALITEFAPGTPPDARNFPRRNRIISGLGLGVLVVEAPAGSGALITADLAAEQGRDVFAVPGNIFNPASRGSNQLIQDGAKLVTNAEDILNELNLSFTQVETRTVTERIAPGTETEARLVNLLSADALHVDEISRLTTLPIAEVTATLTILELKGLAQKVGPMQYCLVQTAQKQGDSTA